MVRRVVWVCWGLDLAVACCEPTYLLHYETVLPLSACPVGPMTLLLWLDGYLMMMSATEGAAALLCAEHAAAVVQGCFVLPGYSQEWVAHLPASPSCSGALRHGDMYGGEVWRQGLNRPVNQGYCCFACASTPDP